MKHRSILGGALVLALAATLLVFSNLNGRAQQGDSPGLSARVFELRTYHANEGKLDDLHARFRDHTNHLFVKHGMDLVGYWTPTEGDGAGKTLVYMIAHESRDAARASWRAFGSDPEWRKVFQESRADGALVGKIESQFLAPTDYSPIR